MNPNNITFGGHYEGTKSKKKYEEINQTNQKNLLKIESTISKHLLAKVTALPQEQIVLAALNGSNSSQSYRPRLIEFYGYEGEDFRHFEEILESFLAISNTNSDARKLVILKSQLRRAAKTYFERVILNEYPNVIYTAALDLLKNYYSCRQNWSHVFIFCLYTLRSTSFLSL